MIDVYLVGFRTGFACISVVVVVVSLFLVVAAALFLRDDFITRTHLHQNSNSNSNTIFCQWFFFQIYLPHSMAWKKIYSIRIINHTHTHHSNIDYWVLKGNFCIFQTFDDNNRLHAYVCVNYQLQRLVANWMNGIFFEHPRVHKAL